MFASVEAAKSWLQRQRSDRLARPCTRLSPWMGSASLTSGFTPKSPACSTHIRSFAAKALGDDKTLSPLKSLLLPLRRDGRRDSSTWLQFCSRLLPMTHSRIFRRRWRLATRVSCPIHGAADCATDALPAPVASRPSIRSAGFADKLHSLRTGP